MELRDFHNNFVGSCFYLSDVCWFCALICWCWVAVSWVWVRWWDTANPPGVQV